MQTSTFTQHGSYTHQNPGRFIVYQRRRVDGVHKKKVRSAHQGSPFLLSFSRPMTTTTRRTIGRNLLFFFLCFSYSFLQQQKTAHPRLLTKESIKEVDYSQDSVLLRFLLTLGQFPCSVVQSLRIYTHTQRKEGLSRIEKLVLLLQPEKKREKKKSFFGLETNKRIRK